MSKPPLSISSVRISEELRKYVEIQWRNVYKFTFCYIDLTLKVSKSLENLQYSRCSFSTIQFHWHWCIDSKLFFQDCNWILKLKDDEKDIRENYVSKTWKVVGKICEYNVSDKIRKISTRDEPDLFFWPDTVKKVGYPICWPDIRPIPFLNHNISKQITVISYSFSPIYDVNYITIKHVQCAFIWCNSK